MTSSAGSRSRRTRRGRWKWRRIREVTGAIVDGIPQITVQELKRKQDAGEDFFLLDVREPHEVPIATLGAPLIPVGSLEARLGEIPVGKDAEIVIHCRSGARSQKAALILKNAGFTHVANLAGGILDWADKIDPSMAKY